MNPYKEVKLVDKTIKIAQDQGLLTEVIWSALKASGSIEDKLNYGLSEWIK